MEKKNRKDASEQMEALEQDTSIEESIKSESGIESWGWSNNVEDATEDNRS